MRKCSLDVNDPACLDPQGQVLMQVANAIMAISKGPHCVLDAVMDANSSICLNDMMHACLLKSIGEK